MKITAIKLGRISVPLRVPFKTALRRVDSVEDIIVEVHTDTGEIGYGEAPPTGAITGDTKCGNLAGVEHDAGIFFGKRPYLLAVLTTEQPASYVGRETIGMVSLLCARAFGLLG